MALVFKPGKELILMEKKYYRKNWKKNVREVFLNLKDEVESTAIFLDAYKKERITRRRAQGRLC